MGKHASNGQRLSEIIAALSSRPPALLRWFAKDHRGSALDRVNLRSHPSLLRYVFPILFDPNSVLAAKAEEKIVSLTRELRPLDVAQLDAVYRQSGWISLAPQTFDPQQLEALSRSPNAAHLLSVATMSANGHVRQKAIELLAERNSGHAVPFLILRLNDWVAPVRSAAAKSLLGMLKDESLEALLLGLTLEGRFKNWSRTEGASVIDQLNAFLCARLSLERLADCLKNPDPKFRRVCARIAGQSSLPVRQAYELVRLDPDASVRFAFWNAASSRLDSAERAQFSLDLFNDKSPRLRLEAIRIAGESDPMREAELAERAILDKSLSVQVVARHVLRKRGATVEELGTRYRIVLASNPLSIPAIMGLKDVGVAADARDLLSLLSSERAPIRRAAFRTIAKLDPDLLKPLAPSFLEDRSVSVIREARSFLISQRSALQYSELSAIFFRSESLATKRAVLSVSRKLPKWDRLIYFLAALGHRDELTNELNSRLQHWERTFNRSPLSATTVQLQRIDSLLNDKAKWIENPDAIRRLLT